MGTAAAGICNVWSLRADTRERSWGKQQELGASTGRHRGEAAERGACVGQGTELWGCVGQGNWGRGWLEGAAGRPSHQGCACLRALLWGGLWVRGVRGRGGGSEWMHRPRGRGLGEAGPGPCRSLGTSPLPPSPLAHSGSIFISLPPARGRQRCLRPSHGAGRGWGALAQGRHGAPCPAPACAGGHSYPQHWGQRQCPPKAGPISPAFPLPPEADYFQLWLSIPKGRILPVGPHSGGGTCSRGSPALPQGMALQGDCRVQGGVLCPSEPGGGAPRSSPVPPIRDSPVSAPAF